MVFQFIRLHFSLHIPLSYPVHLSYSASLCSVHENACYCCS